jgi:hypothetical protein
LIHRLLKSLVSTQMLPKVWTWGLPLWMFLNSKSTKQKWLICMNSFYQQSNQLAIVP